ncbi:MAG: glycosyltransferase family 4 protein, partial [Flavobacteriaceae bacterium]|nr:glycosyltransferase family 4 protein [Flavobacteriaceae bacterium]
MKLAIISHTEHYLTEDGVIVGWGPTVNEINHLLEVYDEITHLAMLYKGDPPQSAHPYKSDKITFVPIPAVGGKSFLSKLNIIWNAPQTLMLISKHLKTANNFQFRAPTGIGVYLIPYLILFSKKKGWFKYAGNWNQKNAPIGYGLQRWFLKHQKRTVTINGSWEGQPKHCLTFENPCLTAQDLSEGEFVVSNKRLNLKLSFCFVGRLEREKGVERIIKAFSALTIEEKEKIDQVYFVGDGNEADYFKDIAAQSGIRFNFKGYLSRNSVFDIYKRSHFFLLPSLASEGFPKVIAEAMNFGCVPIVSNVSAITQYVTDGINGYVVDPVTIENLSNHLRLVISIKKEAYRELISSNNMVQKFSYGYYNHRIKNDIF